MHVSLKGLLFGAFTESGNPLLSDSPQTLQLTAAPLLWFLCPGTVGFLLKSQLPGLSCHTVTGPALGVKMQEKRKWGIHLCLGPSPQPACFFRILSCFLCFVWRFWLHSGGGMGFGGLKLPQWNWDSHPNF